MAAMRYSIRMDDTQRENDVYLESGGRITFYYKTMNV